MIKYVVTFTLLLFTHISHADEMTLIDKIERDARAWLMIIDRAQYVNGWQNASPLLQKTTQAAKWVKTTDALRKPLGAMKSRYLASAGTIESVSGFPDGEYVVVQFYTKFEHKQLVLETLTLLTQNNETWSIVDYATR